MKAGFEPYPWSGIYSHNKNSSKPIEAQRLPARPGQELQTCPLRHISVQRYSSRDLHPVQVYCNLPVGTARHLG